jgi:hypothetical protein
VAAEARAPDVRQATGAVMCDGLARMSTGGHPTGAAETRLATYGTLAPGRPNHGHLSDVPGRWLVGEVRGTLIEAGWGATVDTRG